MSRILLLLDHVENRRILAEWLSREHEVLGIGAPEEIDGDFDLGIVDTSGLERHGRWLSALRLAVHPIFLPVLLVAHRHGPGAVTGAVWERIDELIVTPVEKLELRARVQTLLRVRALSLTNAALARRLEAELARAREVQTSLLPRDAPVLRGYDLAARCIPAREIGGDFFDWQICEDVAVFSVGDVMGKGIPAALLAATVRAVLRALAQHPPGETLDLLRKTLTHDLERTSSFVTLIHARVDPQEIRYADAGHGHALVRRRSGALERLERGGRPVGFPAVAPYREGVLRLGSGDVLVVFSDGLVAGSSEDAEQLIRSVDPGQPSMAMVEQLVERAPKPDSVDDVTVLVLKSTA